ncbi:MAG TPA: hypothetical protein VLF16_11375 [Pseudomonas sp.]|nr:hypothetical protein [Pseudomonas sp.]
MDSNTWESATGAEHGGHDGTPARTFPGVMAGLLDVGNASHMSRRMTITGATGLTMPGELELLLEGREFQPLSRPRSLLVESGSLPQPQGG